MIVTSLPRSGSTYYCKTLAEELGASFYDEPFEYHINPYHKAALHGVNPIMTGKSVALAKAIDFNFSVVNNHEISFFSLERTDVYLSRENVQDGLWSYISYMKRYHEQFVKFIPLTMFLAQRIREYGMRATYFYEYCCHLKKEVIVPSLLFTATDVFRTEFSAYKDQVERSLDGINLPPHLRCE